MRGDEMPFEIKIENNELRLTLPLAVRTCALCDVAMQPIIRRVMNSEEVRNTAPDRYLGEAFEGWHHLRVLGIRAGEGLLCPACAAPLEAAALEAQRVSDVVQQDLAARILARRAEVK
jgi:hypothetical protein